tara:strand:+ start:37682 stop:37969 length:288 start_codon:yes stop_codon:yes gene_type:complete
MNIKKIAKEISKSMYPHLEVGAMDYKKKDRERLVSIIETKLNNNEVLDLVSEPLFKQSEVKMICEKLARACTPSAYIRGIDERFEKWWNATINAS